eukprot:3863031-Pyramimonas_sp.AAC.1
MFRAVNVHVGAPLRRGRYDGRIARHAFGCHCSARGTVSPIVPYVYQGEVSAFGARARRPTATG